MLTPLFRDARRVSEGGRYGPFGAFQPVFGRLVVGQKGAAPCTGFDEMRRNPSTEKLKNAPVSFRFARESLPLLYGVFFEKKYIPVCLFGRVLRFIDKKAEYGYEDHGEKQTSRYGEAPAADRAMAPIVGGRLGGRQVFGFPFAYQLDAGTALSGFENRGTSFSDYAAFCVR